jgi:hypothetical protein
MAKIRHDVNSRMTHILINVAEIMLGRGIPPHRMRVYMVLVITDTILRYR